MSCSVAEEEEGPSSGPGVKGEGGPSSGPAAKEEEGPSPGPSPGPGDQCLLLRCNLPPLGRHDLRLPLLLNYSAVAGISGDDAIEILLHAEAVWQGQSAPLALGAVWAPPHWTAPPPVAPWWVYAAAALAAAAILAALAAALMRCGFFERKRPERGA